MMRWLLRSTPPRFLLAAALLCALPAGAARTSHLFLDESQLVPEGSLELEQWIWAYGRIPNQINRPASIWVWWGPAVALTNHLELELPLQLVSVPDATNLYSLSLVARYRIFPREDDTGFQPLIRIAYEQPLTSYAGPPSVEATLVVTYGSLESIRFTLNAGAVIDMPFLKSNEPGEVTVLGKVGAGVSFPVGKELRLAAETLWQFPVHGATHPGNTQLYLGPSLAWTRGPFWVTFGSLFGLTSDSSRWYPRLLWGVAL
jgi:hypothetical protein